MLLPELRKRVWQANMQLPEHGLVTWPSGNVSGRDVETNLVVIRSCGVPFEALTPENLVIVDLDGVVVESDGIHEPSSDTGAHLYIYRHRADVRGIVHTHSNYATALAATGRPIPPVLTAIADEFGGPASCDDYARVSGGSGGCIGDDEIGREIIRSIGRSPAILLKQHGVFAIGPTPEAALRAAVMVEDVAKTVWLALQSSQESEVRSQ